MIPVHLLVHAVGRSITVKVDGCAVRRVTCEFCQLQYIFQVKREAQGSAYAWFHLNVAARTLDARADGQKKLTHVLEMAVDAVPCPNCGCLQWDMIRLRRRTALKRCTGSAFALAIPLLIFYVTEANGLWPREVSTLVRGATAVLAVGYLLAFLLILLRDPNRSAGKRTRAALGAKCRAMPAEEFDALLAEGVEDSP